VLKAQHLGKTRCAASTPAFECHQDANLAAGIAIGFDQTDRRISQKAGGSWGCRMRKFGFALAALAAAFLFTGGIAEAQQKRAKVVVTPTPWYASWGTWWARMPWTVRDPKLADSNFVVGGGATGAYFALRSGHKHAAHGIHSGFGAYAATSFACAAVSPIVGTIVTQRELTQREVFVSTANCVVPVLGGWWMNATFDHYGWDKPKKKMARR
jgi:hypothetical protein